jgi:hypothetical protein
LGIAVHSYGDLISIQPAAWSEWMEVDKYEWIGLSMSGDSGYEESDAD